MSDACPDAGLTVVAGGAGFLGSHLCRELLARGDTVVCMDNFLTGSIDNITPLLAHPRFSVLQHDIINPMPDHLRPTRIYNLACPASPRHYQANPLHTLRTCVHGAYNLLERATECGARILQASTSEVYGDAQVHPQHERYHGNVNPVGLRSCYDEGKRCAETLFTDFALHRGTSVKIARIFNTYGPGMAVNDGRVVSNFICQALAVRPLTVYGDGSQTRSLCYVSDMIEGLMRLMDSPESFRGPVNLGNITEVSVLQIARQVCDLAALQGPHRIEYLPLPPDDPVSRCPDITLARHHLGWQPTVTLNDGLALTFRYFADNAACAADADMSNSNVETRTRPAH